MRQKRVGILALDQHEQTKKYVNEIEQEFVNERILVTMMPLIIEEDYTAYDAFIILPYEEQTLEREEVKNILNEIRFEETKGKPVFAYGNAAKLLLESNFIPEAINVEIRENGSVKLPTTVHLMHLSTRTTSWTKRIQEDEIITAQLIVKEGCILIKEEISDEKEKTKISNNLFLHDQIAFCYCSPEGDMQQSKEINPYNAKENIAAMHNRHGNVLLCVPALEKEGMKKVLDSLKEAMKEASSQRNTENINTEETRETTR